MQTIQMSDLRPHSYINHNGEIIGKEDAQIIIASGVNPILYTVSDEFINSALHAAYQEYQGGNVSDSYSAPDQYAKRILY